MKKTLSLCLLSLLIMSLLTLPAFSQTGKELVEKIIEAQGGRKLLESIKDTTLTSTLDMTQMGISGSATMYQKDPDKMRLDIEVMGMVFTQAFDGKVGWMTNPQTGATEEMSEKMTEHMKRDALGDETLLHPEKYGVTYEYKGKEKIEEKDYLVLVQTYADGYKNTIYIDPKTYLPYKTRSMALNMMETEVEQDTFLTDYKKVEGVMTPHTITVFQDGEEYMIVTITDVKFNTGFEDDFFKMTE